MKRRAKWQWLTLLAILLVAAWWVCLHRDTPTHDQLQRSESQSERMGDRRGNATVTPVRELHLRRPRRPAPANALDGVQSPLARLYLSYLVPGGGRLAGESHGGSIVNNAFSQAWGVSVRLGLSDEQQERLAEFLLEEDWLAWKSMDPARVDSWAHENLSETQQTDFRRFLAEHQQAVADHQQLMDKIRKLEHGDRSPEEILEAEMATLQKLLAPDSNEIAAGDLAAGAPDAQTLKAQAKLSNLEQAFRTYNLLADRIPLTARQHASVYGAIRSGKAPSNPYDYQSLAPEGIEPKLRTSTAWMTRLLSKEQYETYVRYALAEIEMIRFQIRR